MRHAYCWPWRFAYAANTQNTYQKHVYESRWHGNRGRNFGVRRPLRYLTYHLDLDENQTRRMASVLNQLKTEREQAELDEKRTTAELARLLENGTPTLDEARQALAARVESAKVLQEETAKAIVSVSDFLDDDQREQFINLLLTGAISL